MQAALDLRSARQETSGSATPTRSDGLSSPLPVVLYAARSPAQRVLVGALLDDICRLLAVPDGVAALMALEHEPPKAILCDLRLAGLDGMELLRRVKAEPRWQRIPFILRAGEDAAACHGLEAGADDYLVEPFGPLQLRSRVAAAVRAYATIRELETNHAELVRALSESKRLQLELNQSQKLEAVGRLAATIAHEINTPIQFIGDSSSFLGTAVVALGRMLAAQRAVLARVELAEAERQALARLEEELDLAFVQEQALPAVERTQEGVKRVASIVKALKEFAHPDQKVMVAADLNRALLATLEVARHECKYVADVETDLAELPPVVCHPGDLNQVFLNLIVNAAHAIGDVVRGTPARGRITVTTRAVDGAVLVTVRDTGGGIPEAIRSKIFEPFFTTKEVGRGTGQGLALARSVVEQHGGAIHFESTLGEGTTFTVSLPADTEGT